MSKERLEEITSSVGILLSGDKHVLLRRKHYEWLIEQAERVQELEKQNKLLSFIAEENKIAYEQKMMPYCKVCGTQQKYLINGGIKNESK